MLAKISNPASDKQLLRTDTQLIDYDTSNHTADRYLYLAAFRTRNDVLALIKFCTGKIRASKRQHGYSHVLPFGNFKTMTV